MTPAPEEFNQGDSTLPPIVPKFDSRVIGIFNTFVEETKLKLIKQEKEKQP